MTGLRWYTDQSTGRSGLLWWTPGNRGTVGTGLAWSDENCPCCPEMGCCPDDINLPDAAEAPTYASASLLEMEIMDLTGDSDCWGTANVGDKFNLEPDGERIWRCSSCLSDRLTTVTLECLLADTEEFHLEWTQFLYPTGSCLSPCPGVLHSQDAWQRTSLTCSPFELRFTYTFTEAETIPPGANPCWNAGCDSTATIEVKITKRAGSPP